MNQNKKKYKNQFLAGLIEFSNISLLTMVFVVVAVFSLCVFIINKDFFVSQYQLFMENSFDQYTYLSAKILKQKNQVFNNDAVFIIGASSTHESFISESLLETMVMEKCSTKVSVNDYCAPGLWNWEMLAVVDMLPEHFNGLVILPSSLSRFSSQARREEEQAVKSPKIGFRSGLHDVTLQSAGHRIKRQTGNFFFDNYTFILVHLPYFFKNILTEKPVFKLGYYGTIPKIDSVTWNSTLVPNQRLKADFDSLVVSNALQIYVSAFKEIKKRGNVEIVLLQDPINPRFLETVPASGVFEKYQKVVKEFAAANGVEFWDLNDQMNFKDDDFYDHAHLRDSLVRYKYTKILSNSIAAVLTREEK